jgi:hypothetical protein
MDAKSFRLLMIGAMYENGGNTTHRFLDGHPELFVYPFESQLGTRLVNDHLSSTFPVKYRWPVFPLDGTPADDYEMIMDEEGKVRSRTPFVSKFRDYPFALDDDDRQRRYVDLVRQTGRSTGNNVAAFFRATFDAWTDFNRSGREKVYVGYSPIVVVDSEKILRDLPNTHILHIVRNPWSAFADTSKRPVPMSLESYILGWVINQQHALMFKALHPESVHVLRIEDVLGNPRGTLGGLCEKLGLEAADTLSRVSWNGRTLEQVYPWGTIRTPTPEANRATARELTPAQRDEIRIRAGRLLDDLDYRSFI